jgi:uncharacterized circularly permuted ATP-grasp superfamily protein/uncharacterized alpha-E superfamily protein
MSMTQAKGKGQAQNQGPQGDPLAAALGAYAPVPGDADELLQADGTPRPYWAPLVRALGAHEGSVLRDINRETRRLVDELGVTYHVYSDPVGVQRPWPLDAIPHLLCADEWDTIEQALVQRARLFEWIIQDVLGPGELLRAGILPPEFLAAHNAFLQPVRGTLRADLPALTLYAADLARGPDGRFWVLGDRTQAPSGAGYALQNREILSRTWPAAFSELGVQGLGRFFRGLHQGLRDLARSVSEPRIVLLSPGPLNEAWFEHVLLARQLGLTLVQGQDLVFRDGCIWLSTLGQMERVDVILRRVDDAWCDPLSLDPDSRLGVAGLVEAVRRGNVVVANALGTGLLESPAWPAFLPAIARFALGEDLLLPSVATWWCGEPDSLEHVIAHSESLVVRSIDRTEGGRPLFLAGLPEEERRRLCAQIRMQPTRFVGQECIGLSTMPCLNEAGFLEPRHGTVRAFACQCPDGPLVLPGGLTRVASRPGTRLVSNQEGGVSKDTWVLRRGGAALGPADAFPEPEPGVRQPASLPRRVADNLLWVGRYAERAEGLIRWLRLVLRRLQVARFEGRSGDEVTGCMLRALTHLSGSYPGFVGADGKGRDLDRPEMELLRLLTDGRVPGSVPSALNALHNTANALRDRLSAESVRVLTGLREVGQPLAGLRDPLAAEGILGDLTVHLLALSGLAHESMLRHHGWRFMDSGRRLERGLMLVNLLRATLVVPPEPRQAVLLSDMVLAFAESLSIFRSRPANRRTALGLLDLLLLEPENPRALIYQLDRLVGHVEQLPRLGHGERLPEHARHLEEARSRLRLAVVEDLAEPEGGLRSGLDRLLLQQQQELAACYQAMFAHYLAPAPTLPLVGRAV